MPIKSGLSNPMLMNDQLKGKCGNLTDLKQYILVAQPSPRVKKLIEEKEFLVREKFAFAGTLREPQIFVAGFFAKELMEETLSRWIQNICNLQSSFEVVLNNFGSIPPQTLCIRIQNQEPFLNLAHHLKMVDSFICANDCPPLITLSKAFLSVFDGLPSSLYGNALDELSHHLFHESFIINQMNLLKLKDGVFKKERTFFLVPGTEYQVPGLRSELLTKD